MKKGGARAGLLLVLGLGLGLVARGVVVDPLVCYVSEAHGCTAVADLSVALGPAVVASATINPLNACASYCQLFDLGQAALLNTTVCYCLDAPAPKPVDLSVGATNCTKPPCCPGNHDGTPTAFAYTYQCSGTRLPNSQACVTARAQDFAFCDANRSVDERLDDLSRRLSLTDKIRLFTPQDAYGGDHCSDHTAAYPDLDIPNWLWLTETNTDVAAACLAPDRCPSTFPGPLGMAASFNASLWFAKGDVLATELRAFSNTNWHRSNVDNQIQYTGFGPNINIARDPRFGRTSELPGEDPYLSGTYATHMVRGMMQADAAGHPKMLAYLKHFTAYSTETNRQHSDFNVSSHDLWDTYLPQYEMAFRSAQPAGAMCSYNAVNGRPSCANGYILRDVLRNQWQQPNAHITSDCGAISSLRGAPVFAPDDATAAAVALNNGTDLEMGSQVYASLAEAVARNLTSSTLVEEAFRRAARILFRGGRFDPPATVEWNAYGVQDINSSATQALVHEATAQSLVLLQNRHGILPLAPGQRVAVVGPLVERGDALLSDYASLVCYDGTYDCIPTLGASVTAANKGGATTVVPGVDVNSNNSSGLAAAVAAAQAADVVVAFLGTDKTIEREGLDRVNLTLPGLQGLLLDQLLATGTPVVLLLNNGGPLAIESYLNRTAAVMETFNAGQFGATVMAKALFGQVNNFGKLPYTVYPAGYVTEQAMNNYDMALYPGRTYRYLVQAPVFPFGFGLSYTTFNLACAPNSNHSEVVCNVTNTGSRAGDEVVLAYHALGADARGRADHAVPIRALYAFERVHLAPQATTSVHFPTTAAQALVVNASGAQVLYPGTHQFIVSRGPGDLHTNVDDYVTEVVF